MSRRAETRLDRHVENSDRAGIGIDDLGGYPCEFRRFKFRGDTRFHFRSKRM